MSLFLTREPQAADSTRMSFPATRRLLALTAIVLSNFPFASGCSCRYTIDHLQDLFCKASYVLEIVVTGDETLQTVTSFGYTHEVRRYEIKTTRVYKTSPEYEALASKNYIYTGTNGAVCGVYLSSDVIYLILGSPNSIYNGHMNLGLCDKGYMRADSVTDEQQAYLENGFGENCNKCTIESCPVPEICGMAGSQTCALNLETPSTRCILDFAHCKRVDDKCVWSDGESGSFSDCLNGQA